MNRLTIHNLISSIAQIVLGIIKVDQVPVRVGSDKRQWSRNNDQRSSWMNRPKWSDFCWPSLNSDFMKN